MQRLAYSSRDRYTHTLFRLSTDLFSRNARSKLSTAIDDTRPVDIVAAEKRLHSVKANYTWKEEASLFSNNLPHCVIRRMASVDQNGWCIACSAGTQILVRLPKYDHTQTALSYRERTSEEVILTYFHFPSHSRRRGKLSSLIYCQSETGVP